MEILFSSTGKGSETFLLHPLSIYNLTNFVFPQKDVLVDQLFTYGFLELLNQFRCRL